MPSEPPSSPQTPCPSMPIPMGSQFRTTHPSFTFPISHTALPSEPLSPPQTLHLLSFWWERRWGYSSHGKSLLYLYSLTTNFIDRNDVHTRIKDVQRPKYTGRKFATLRLVQAYYSEKYNLGTVSAVPVQGSQFWPVNSPSPSPPSSPSSMVTDPEFMWDQLSFQLNNTSLNEW